VSFVVAGIGKALAIRLADQGLNVVLVAKPDDLLDATHTELQTTYPKLQFRRVEPGSDTSVLAALQTVSADYDFAFSQGRREFE